MAAKNQTPKLQQILQLTPSNEIVFQGPFKKVVTSYLEIHNPSSKKVCFKVKTTAPRRYCVRPNSGVIDPNGKVKIAIMLQPMDQDSYEERHRHKFMLQSISIENDSTYTPEEIWQRAQETPRDIMDSKLKCVFHEPEETEGDGPDLLQQQQAADSPKQQQQQQQPATNAPSEATNKPITTNEQTPKRQHEDARLVQEQITTSTPQARVTSSTGKAWASGEQTSRRSEAFGSKVAERSLASSHNLTSSFLQPMSDDYKIVLVSLAMLFLGVILGKYII